MSASKASKDPIKCRHGYRTYTDVAGTVHIPTGGKCQDVDPGSDAERDARRAAYKSAGASENQPRVRPLAERLDRPAGDM